MCRQKRSWRVNRRYLCHLGETYTRVLCHLKWKDGPRLRSLSVSLELPFNFLKAFFKHFSCIGGFQLLIKSFVQCIFRQQILTRNFSTAKWLKMAIKKSKCVNNFSNYPSAQSLSDNKVLEDLFAVRKRSLLSDSGQLFGSFFGLFLVFPFLLYHFQWETTCLTVSSASS